MSHSVTIWRNVKVASFFTPDNGTYLRSQILMYEYTLSAQGLLHRRLDHGAQAKPWGHCLVSLLQEVNLHTVHCTLYCTLYTV